MRTKKLITAAALTAAAALALTPLAATASNTQSSSSKGLKVMGLVGDNTLVSFTVKRPGDARKLGSIKGLADADKDIVGIDYRVQDGRLYAVGRGGGVYRVSTKTLASTKVDQLDVTLNGTNFGVDFNPAANALRIVSDTGQNLRHPFADPTTTVTDAPLTVVAPPAAPAAATGVTGAAYTNNDLTDATGTTLFDVSTAADRVFIQAPANAGTLTATGATAVALEGDTGFDIYSSLRKGRTGSNTGFAVNGDRLYAVNLLTGEFAGLGGIGGKGVVTDIALPLNQG